MVNPHYGKPLMVRILKYQCIIRIVITFSDHRLARVHLGCFEYSFGFSISLVFTPKNVI